MALDKTAGGGRGDRGGGRKTYIYKKYIFFRDFWKISFGKSLTKIGILCTPPYKFILGGPFINRRWRLFIVIHIQIECEIDIRTLTSHQVLGQILGQIFGQILGQIFGQILARFLTRAEYSFAVLLGRRNTVLQFYWVRRLPANYFFLFKAYRKTGYPLTTSYTTKLYLFVNVYKKS